MMEMLWIFFNVNIRVLIPCVAVLQDITLGKNCSGYTGSLYCFLQLLGL